MALTGSGRGLARLLRIRPGERRVALRILLLMTVVWSGFSLGATAVESLLFVRFGPRSLPLLFVALGPLTFAVMLGVNSALARARRPRGLLIRAPVAMAVVVAGMRGVLFVDERWVYPLLWLAMMVLWILEGVVSWGVAAAAHDTRQAKRLFPLYGAGLILGTALGGVLTGPLALALGVENLLVVWAVALLGSAFLTRSALRAAGMAGQAARRRGSRPGITEAIRSLRASPLISWMAVSLGLFAVLYNILVFLFATAVTARFPEAGRLAVFLGSFTAVTSGAGLLVSILLANRLYARFGVAAMVVALAVLYLAGFGVLSVWLAFAPLVAFRFLQMVWWGGVWTGAWQALFNVVPPERRDRTRAAMDGVALQGGIVAAGLILLLADRILPPIAVAIIGLAVSVAAVAAAIRLRRAYAGAVVEALREGNPEVFVVEEEPFGGMSGDPAARSAVSAGVNDPDPAVRRLSVEMLAEMAGPEHRPTLLGALEDEDPSVRAASLGGLARLGPGPGLDPVVAFLEDADPLLRTRAAAALRRSVHEDRAVRALQALVTEHSAVVRAAALEALGPVQGSAPAVAALDDPDARVRSSAVAVLARARSPAIVEALDDPDPQVWEEAVDALAEMGDREVAAQAMARSELEAGAMRALARMDGGDTALLTAYVAREVERAAEYADLLGRLGRGDDGRLGLLAHGLRHRAVRHALNAILAAGAHGDAAAIRLAVHDLASRDPAQRANALETLEAVGDARVTRPLLSLWDADSSPSSRVEEVVGVLLGDRDPWLRACAAFAAAGIPSLREVVGRLARADVDTLVREAAAAAVEERAHVETLPTLSLMERMAFLRAVPLFADFTPADLKHVADIATEHAFGEGEAIAEEGEPGEEMFIVVSGSISVRTAGGAELARRAPGDAVGEMAVISRAPRMASLAAMGPVRVLAIDRSRFERILRERPEAALAVMEVLCSRLRESSQARPAEG